LIGHKFMGRAHTHGYTDLPLFFDPGVEVVKQVLCSNEPGVEAAARRWGWEKWTLDWKKVVADPEVDLVDIAAPSAIHAEVAIAAARAGKHCSKAPGPDLAIFENGGEAKNRRGHLIIQLPRCRLAWPGS
jgi:predicted dehydrogenase